MPQVINAQQIPQAKIDSIIKKDSWGNLKNYASAKNEHGDG